VSLIDRLPTRRPRPVRKHRADDRIADLEAEASALRKVEAKLLKSLAAADEFFQQQDGNMTALEQELAAEKQARAVAEADVAVRDRWIADLQRELADTRKRMKVSALAETAATETQEIDPEVVARICGRPVPLHLSPMANPANVPAWTHTP
jgi:chromosome segregation ATPase